MEIPQTVISAIRQTRASGQVDMTDCWQVTKFILFTLLETQAAAWLQQNRARYGEAVQLANEGVTTNAY